MATAKEKPSCLIRTLPPERLGEAARVAADVFPANRPAVAHFASAIPGDESDVLPPQFIAALTSRYWGPTPRILPVRFLDSPTAATRRLILEHMNAWSAVACISFTETTDVGRVRIARAAAGYWSYLGTDILLVPGDQPTMNLQGFTERTSDAEYRRVVRHETGHTLGFPHEHMRRDLVARIDRAKAYAYFAQTQGWSRQDVESQVLTPLDEASLMATPADQTSIMCYQLPGSITVDGRPIPGGSDIDATDYAFAAQIYPLPAGPVVPPSPPPAPPEPPKPKPPEPPAPKPEEFGPFDLRIGVPSDKFTLLPSTTVLFRFRARGHRVFVARTAGKLALAMDLLDADGRVLKSDDDAHGKGGNALVAATLRPGTYTLRVRGMVPEMVGPFRVEVASL